MSVATSRNGAFVGVISDTHGLVREEALEALRGCERIVHAGDIGGPDVLEALSELAPVEAVRGNNDREAWSRDLPLARTVELGRHRLFLVHEPVDVPDDVADEHGIVVVGHTHRPLVERRGSVLHINPGSAGPRRFTLPVTVVRLWTDGDALEAELVEIVPPASRG